ncbi:MAG TPA: hypothetical protein PLO53_13630, partial [Candidatus Hydrogenedentes bacterium]|nr:hypothetical protein [Candidatus Hydrogenedentota bacterium]
DVTEVEKLDQFDEERYEVIKQNTTAQSDSRNVFYLSTPRGNLAFNKVDPNYATPLQLATTFLLAENLGPQFAYDPGASPGAKFAAGLRRGDATLTGYLFGSGYTQSAGAYVLANAAWQTLEEDPFLRALQLAVNLADNRDRDSRASRITLPKEDQGRVPSERERTAPEETLPLDLINDFKVNSLGTDPNSRRLDNTDPWWEAETGNKRRISYTVAGADAIRINEVMARPVRRIEAETNRTDNPTINTNPSPYPGMPSFDVASVGGTLSSASNYLGDRTVVNLPANQVYEIAIRASDWTLPPGRYYLMVNVTDENGNMTVTDSGVLDYCVRNTDATAPGMADEAAYDTYINTLIQNTLAVFAPPSGSPLEAEVNQLAVDLYTLIQYDAVWKTVDETEYLATPNRKTNGVGTPMGWIFLPGSQPDSWEVPDETELPATYPEIYNWIQTTQGLTTPAEIQQWFAENIWNAVTGFYFSDNLFGIPGPGVQTYTVSVPDASSGLELRVTIRINP